MGIVLMVVGLFGALFGLFVLLLPFLWPIGAVGLIASLIMFACGVAMVISSRSARLRREEMEALKEEIGRVQFGERHL